MRVSICDAEGNQGLLEHSNDAVRHRLDTSRLPTGYDDSPADPKRCDAIRRFVCCRAAAEPDLNSGGQPLGMTSTASTRVLPERPATTASSPPAIVMPD